MHSFNDAFEQYFSNKISQSELLVKIGSDMPGFEEGVRRNLQDALLKKDSKNIEYLVYVIMLVEDKISLQDFVEILNKLLICDWHEQHENIVMILQKLHSPLSVDYLKKAIYMNLKYLEWDDNYAFEVKCIWALGYIHNLESKLVLEEITRNSNKILSENAENQLKKYK